MAVVSSVTSASEISAEDLGKYQGYWLAFSPDGHRLIASSLTLQGLDALVREKGENPEEILLHRIPAGDAILSGSELS